ncbi:MAG: ABC transporter ATP-binding protein [Proteobacteria bacterium]|nr:ABC transporter ATP-binding protein [Pseudomonadota bacterium]
MQRDVEQAGVKNPPAVVIRADGLCKAYQMGDVTVRALNGATFEVRTGEMMSIMGPSGSGKSTLMNILGCLDQPTTGTYWLDGTETSQLDDDELASIRNKKIGFVFQQFNLLARTAGVSQRRKRALAALERVGLADRSHHRPTELSGGQQQRVAIARALVGEPAIILADEPTGALDSRTSEEVMAIFQQLNREGITVVFVTHERDIAEHTRRIIRLTDGRIASDLSIPVEEQRIARTIHEPLQTPV